MFGHETAVVGASRSSSSSATEVPESLDAAEILHNEIEKPGALSEVSKSPVKIRTGLIFQVAPMVDFISKCPQCRIICGLEFLLSCVIVSSVRAPSSRFDSPP